VRPGEYLRKIADPPNARQGTLAAWNVRLQLLSKRTRVHITEPTERQIVNLNLLRKSLFVALSLAVAVLLCLVAPSAEAQTVTALHSFGSSGDGTSPAGLIADSSGNLYGTTSGGGANNYGTVFELVNSSGTYSEKVLYSFTDSNGDGASPEGSLIMDLSGNLYGTTYEGGINNGGIVFELINSSGTYTEQILHSFNAQDGDGANPYAGLIMDSSGNLYGTTISGGTGGGIVFELINSSGTYTEQILHSFSQSKSDGVSPYGGLIMDSSGNLYGTTFSGGTGGVGIVFELVNSSGTYTEQVLYSFTGTNGDGAYPRGSLILDSLGNLYGTTQQGGVIGAGGKGGNGGSGIVFELVNSSGTYTEQILHSFNPQNGDGALPLAGVIVDSSGNLYGTTNIGGAYSVGTVFELVNSAGSYSESLLSSFGSSCNAGGSYPFGGLVMDSSGNLYGTTQGGGANGAGVAFSLSHIAGPASPTTTTLTSSPNPATAGNPLVFTATVTSSSGAVSTGTITFYEGSTILGTQAVGACGSASLTVNNPEVLGIGTYTVTAQYTPSLPAFAASSGSMSQTVNEAGVVLTNGNNTLDGNQTVDGSVNASTFVGNGSGLTNVMASGITCTFCIGNTQLGINYAGSSSQGGPASNALLLGGFPASAFQLAGSYATTGANLFTGNQSITGNLSTTGNSTTSGTTTMGPSGTPIVQHLSMTFNPTFPPLKNSCTSQSFTFNGASDGNTVALGIPKERMTAADLIYTAWVSAANTVTIRACAFSTKPTSAGSGAIRVDIWQH
jgi:uncharacterized repeat protein (TIGR03803 family)